MMGSKQLNQRGEAMDLETYLLNNEINKMRFALDLDISLGHLQHIINRSRRPSAKLAKKIEEMTKRKVKKEELLFPEDYE